MRLPAQTASQFPLGAANWIGTTGNPNNGDRDATVVLYFEVPVGTPGPIYFGIDNPGNPGAASAYAPFDQPGTGGTSYWYLVGGQGALSDPSSQLTTYTPYPSSQPLAGTTLATFTRTTQDESWVYFPGVQPSQGELIGNKYYFKIVLQVDANVGKNAFQADVSSSNAGVPIFVTGARSFAFDGSPFMSSTTGGSGRTFDFYPFVSSGETGNISISTWDFDNAVTSATTFNISGTNLGTFTPGGSSSESTASYAIGAQTNGTWHVTIVGLAGGTANDLVELWSTIGTTVLRTYANAVPAQVPDHVTLSYNGTTLPTGGSGQVLVQVVDTSGNPCLISEDAWVTASGSAQITSTNAGSVTPAAGVLVTTDGNGLGSVTVTDAVGESVTVDAATDGTNGSSTLAGTNNSVSVPFSANAPTLSSASSTSILTVTTTTLPVVTISANNGAFVGAANGISVRIPPTLGLTFNTGAVPAYGGTASGRVNAGSSGFTNSTTFFIKLNTSFLTTDTLTLTGLQVVSPANAFSTGTLQLSFDGGSSYPVSDNKSISVNTVGSWTWTAGGGTTLWSNGANWNAGTQPAPNADVIINNTGFQPTVDTAIPAMHNLTIASGATLSAATFDVTVSGTASIAGTYSGGSGTSTFYGTVSGTGTYVASSRANTFGGNLTITIYTTSGGIALFNATSAQGSNGYTFSNLTKMGGSTLTVSGALTVTGTLATNGSSDIVDVGAQSFTVGTLSNSGTLALDGSQGTQAITTMDTAKGTVRYKGAAGGNVRLNSFHNLAISSAGQTFTLLAGGKTVNGALTLATGTLALGGFSVTTTGAASLAATVTNAGAAATFSVGGATTVTGNTSIATNGGAITFTGTVNGLAPAAQSLALNAGAAVATLSSAVGSSASLSSLSVTGSSINLPAVTTTGAQTVTATTISANGTYSTTNADITFAGSLSLGGSTTFSTGSGALSLGAVSAAASNLIIQNAASSTGATMASVSLGTGTLNLAGVAAGTVTVSGTLTAQALTTAAAACNVALDGGGTVTNAVSFLNAGTLSISSGFTFSAGLTATAPSSVSVAGTITTSSGSIALGSTTVTANATLAPAASPITIGGSLTINGGATLNPSGVSITISGNWTDNGSFTSAGTTVTFSGGGPPQAVTPGASSFANLSLTAGSVIDFAGNNFTISGTLSNLGVLTLDGSQATQSIATMDTANGTVRYKGAGGGTVRITGNAFSTFEVASGTISLSAPIAVNGNLLITGGALDVTAANHQVTVKGDWQNTGGAFVPRQGTVSFTKPAPGPLHISGSNQWYVLDCEVPGITILFEQGKTQTMVAGGAFKVMGTSGSHISVSSISGATQWFLLLTTGAETALTAMAYVDVDWSNISPLTDVPANVTVTLNCTGWKTIIPVMASSTEDLNGDGSIDAILVTVSSNVGNDFSGFKVHVNGYALNVDSSLAPPRAFETTADDPSLLANQFRILLREGGGLDTDATPRWFIDANGTFKDAVVPTFYVGLANPAAGQLTTDGAPPRIGYTLAVAGRNEVFVRFSEPVTAPGGAPIAAGDFSSSAGAVTGLTRVTSSGSGTSEALLTLNLSLKAGDMINATAPASITAVTALPDAAAVPNVMPPGPARTHRVSDVGLGLPGSAVMEPVWAKDQAIQNTKGSGIGLLNVFDGSAWLRRQLLTIEGHVDVTVSGTTTANLWWDAAAAGAPANGFWLPPFATTSFNGLVSAPDATAVGPLAAAQPSTLLRDFLVDATDTRIKNGSVLQFLFEVVDGAQRLYAARLLDPNAADWYRRLAPWEITLRDIVEQRVGVSILNNVISPAQGQVATLHYVLSTGGNVSIQVFDLAGNIVRILERGSDSAGDYFAAWDGKNQGGRSVARGVYFVRIVAPGIDETRKVLVVR